MAIPERDNPALESAELNVGPRCLRLRNQHAEGWGSPNPFLTSPTRKGIEVSEQLEPKVPSDDEQGLVPAEAEVTYVVRVFHTEFESTDMAAASGPGAAKEAYYYAGQYVDEGIRVDVVKRTEEVLFSVERGGVH